MQWRHYTTLPSRGLRRRLVGKSSETSEGPLCGRRAASYRLYQRETSLEMRQVFMAGSDDGCRTPEWIVARKTLPAKDLSELIAWLKENPGKATWGMVGVLG